MSKISTIAEQKLSAMQPGKLDEGFMSRLVATAEGSICELNPEELEYENFLRAFAPRQMPAAQHASLVEAIRNTPFHVDEKIVLFHKSASHLGGKVHKPATRRFRFNLAAAAAVALLGSLSALLIPTQDLQISGQQAPDQRVAPVTDSAVSKAYAPAGFNRNLRDTHDEGVIWNGANRPHRVLRFTYTDRMTLKNDQGETMQVERPREEYILIPEKLD